MFKLALVFGLVTLVVANFQQECLKAHNDYRRKHSAPPLAIDNNLQNIAQNYANYLARYKLFDHSKNGYGENLYRMRGSTAINGATAVDSWYNEIFFYNWNNPGFNKKTGHFTQVVWKSSKSLGCAYAINGNDIYVVANYNPGGNVKGQFPQNVSIN